LTSPDSKAPKGKNEAGQAFVYDADMMAQADM